MGVVSFLDYVAFVVVAFDALICHSGTKSIDVAYTREMFDIDEKLGL